MTMITIVLLVTMMILCFLQTGWNKKLSSILQDLTLRLRGGGPGSSDEDSESNDNIVRAEGEDVRHSTPKVSAQVGRSDKFNATHMFQ